jgi:hypothetical protein
MLLDGAEADAHFIRHLSLAQPIDPEAPEDQLGALTEARQGRLDGAQLVSRQDDILSRDGIRDGSGRPRRRLQPGPFAARAGSAAAPSDY